jgi:predicted alpha/beta-hydrolase family hydrolase
MEKHGTLSNNTYTLEKAKVNLANGSETSLVYAIPSQLRDPSTCLIIAHGAGGPMFSPFISYFHTGLAKQGFLTVKFNFAYMEARRKTPDKTDVLENCYQTIIDQARSRHETDRALIGGKSMGGRIASQVAAKNTVDVDGLFFLGYPLHPPGRTDRLRDEHLYKINKPMLFISGTRDNFARRDLLEKVVKKIGPIAQLKWIDDGDHSFKKHGSAPDKVSGTEEAFAILLEWLERVDRSSKL